MKIAWITYDFEEYSSLHVNALAADHEVLLVMPRADNDAPTYHIAPGVEHYAFDNPRLRQPLRQLQSVRSILNRIHAFAPDVIHFQQGHMWFNSALRRLRRKYPLVITVHDPRHHAGDKLSKKTPQWLMDHGFRQADHAIVHGEALVEQVHKLFHIRRERIHVIPHVAMGTAFAQRQQPAVGNQVLFFGRIYDYKGLEYLIRAEPLVSRQIPDVKFVIGGTGDNFQRYRAMMQNPDRFIIHNRWIDDEERGQLFRQASVVVLPYNEATQSGVVPVAYNYSKPVIATRVGALEECVDHESTGLLVPPRDVAALAGAIVRILSDDSLRQRMGIAAREKLDRELAPEVVAAQTASVYQAAITDSQHRKRGRESFSNEPCSDGSPSWGKRHSTTLEQTPFVEQRQRPLRVLAITPKLPHPSDPGSNAPLLRQIESLQGRGIEVDVIEMRGTPMLKYVTAVPRLRRLLSQVDLVHAHFGFCGWLGRAQFRKPLVISFMGDDLLGEPTDAGGISRFSRIMVRANVILSRYANQVIVKSPEMASVVGKARAHVVPNGVDTQKFSPLPREMARDRLGWPQQQCVVLFPGNPENPRKGLELAKAATRFAERELGTEIRIQPLWGVSPDDVPLYMNASDAMWMTSMIEGSPNVVKEALACNRPIVAVPVGDVQHQLEGVEGCRVETRDPDRLGQAMAHTLRHHKHSRGRAAIQEARLDLDSVAERVEQIYRRALELPPRAPQPLAPDAHNSTLTVTPPATSAVGSQLRAS